MVFHFEQKVLFRHCDPAGIVFYPRYFEMLNDCVEAFFDQALGTPFESIHRNGAVPTASIEATFHAPSRHGDRLSFVLTPDRPGTSSLRLGFHVSCDGAPRLSATSTLVNVDSGGRPTPWTDTICHAISKDMT